VRPQAPTLPAAPSWCKMHVKFKGALVPNIRDGQACLFDEQISHSDLTFALMDSDSSCSEAPDISGIGVRIAFYIQTITCGETQKPQQI
jgi:hypothetical protein